MKYRLYADYYNDEGMEESLYLTTESSDRKAKESKRHYETDEQHIVLKEVELYCKNPVIKSIRIEKKRELPLSFTIFAVLVGIVYGIASYSYEHSDAGKTEEAALQLMNNRENILQLEDNVPYECKILTIYAYRHARNPYHTIVLIVSYHDAVRCIELQPDTIAGKMAVSMNSAYNLYQMESGKSYELVKNGKEIKITKLTD